MTQSNRTGRLVIAIVAGLVAWRSGTVLVAAAEVDPVALVWTAPAECPRTDLVHDQIEKVLGGSAKDLAPVAAVVTVAKELGRWQAALTLHSRGQRTDRQFDAETCEALASATTLIIALAAEGPDEPPGTEGEQPPAAGHPDRETPARPTTGNAPSYALQLGAVLDRGTMPNAPQPGVEAAVVRTWASSVWRLRLAAGSTFLLPAYGPNEWNATGWYWTLTLSARGCATAVLAWFEFGPCVGAEVAAMHATHVAGTPTNQTQFWVAPAFSALVAITISPRMVVFVRTDLLVPNTRRTFIGEEAYQSINVDYTVATVALRGSAGVEYRFF